MPKSSSDSFDIYCRQISRTPLLTKEGEQKLVAIIRSSNATEHERTSATKRLTEANLRLVIAIVQEDYRSLVRYRMDMVQEGNIGLMKAAEKYEDWGGKFSTYAADWIHRFIRIYLSTHEYDIMLSPFLRGEIHRIRSTALRLSEDLGREPSHTEIAEILHTNASRVTGLLEVGSAPISMQATIDDEEETEFGSLIVDNSPLPNTLVEQGDLTTRLRALLAKLTPAQRHLVEERYLADEPQTKRGYGRMIGRSDTHVAKKEREILQMLREDFVGDMAHDLTSNPRGAPSPSTSTTQSVTSYEETRGRKPALHLIAGETDAENALIDQKTHIIGIPWGVSVKPPLPLLTIPRVIRNPHQFEQVLQLFLRSMFDARCWDCLGRFSADEESTPYHFLHKIRVLSCDYLSRERDRIDLFDLARSLAAWLHSCAPHTVADEDIRRNTLQWIAHMRPLIPFSKNCSRKRSSNNDPRVIEHEPITIDSAVFLGDRMRRLFPHIVGPDAFLLPLLVEQVAQYGHNPESDFFRYRYFFPGTRQPSQEAVFARVKKDWDIQNIGRLIQSETTRLHYLASNCLDQSVSRALGADTRHFVYQYSPTIVEAVRVLRGSDRIGYKHSLAQLHTTMHQYPVDKIVQLLIQSSSISPYEAVQILSGKVPAEGVLPHNTLQIAMMLGTTMEQVKSSM